MTAYRGRIVSGGPLQIPADVRRGFGLADGDKVRLEVIDGELRLRSFEAAIKAIQQEVRSYIPKRVSLAAGS